MALSVPRREGTGTDVRRLYQTLLYVTSGTRGGRSRLEILRLVRFEPLNAQKISARLGLNYKTVRHHLSVLELNGVVTRIPKQGYGGLYFLTPEVEESLPKLISGLRYAYPETVDWDKQSLTVEWK